MTVAPIRDNSIMSAARTMGLKHKVTPDLCESNCKSKCNNISSGSQQYVDGLLEKAKVRWLKVPEIEYLLDPETSPLPILSKPPCVQPKSGTVFLFDRNVTTNYKEDGYYWVKKRNSSKVREDHVKLRTNGEYRVAGMYCHSSNPVSLHRRAYHLLDPTTGVTRSPVTKMKKNRDSFNANVMPSLVLVHYLDTVEAAERMLVSSTRQSKGSFGVKREFTGIEEPAMKKSRVQHTPSCHNEILSRNEMERNERNGYYDMCYPSIPMAVTSVHIPKEIESYPRNVERETETSQLEKTSAQISPYDILSDAYPENEISVNNDFSVGAHVPEVSDEEYDQSCDEVFDTLWDLVMDSNVNFEEIIKNSDCKFPGSADMTLAPGFLGNSDYFFH
eukprot:CAMPEP_0172495142 /NCGR_PEP_ID=MMETSP1066-20121228/64174_1 /TAXON_ID=671091 /ORGANISM="Coscinodiscus wailesii, Strain CCMP2513" /LENGTH=387 /DNA_ID=CAMNT_0013266629 /DNA_START=59 /DNA_END=1222 /DNA_ORIENTATION=-